MSNFGLTPPILYPNSIGPRASYAHIEMAIPLLGLRFPGHKKIEYSRERSREMPMGAHPDPLGKTVGENAYKASIEVYFEEFVKWITKAASLAPQGYGDLFFEVYVTYNVPGFIVTMDEIQGCTIDTTGASNSQGSSALTRTIDLNPTKILFAGLNDTIPLAFSAISL